MRLTKIIILLSQGMLIGSLATSVCAQTNAAIGNVTISSPTAGSLGKYGDIPVGYHTGIPDISIPIYTIRSGTLQLPIGLSYHASGLKAQEQASWVGAGWALNAGGVITRTVVGAPDDKGLQPSTTQKGHYSDYGYNSYLFSAGPTPCTAKPNLCPVGRTGMPASNYAAQDVNIESGVFDGEPDLYFFNFNGYAGKFYFNDDRSAITMPEQDLQITPIYTGTDWRGFSGFIIKTPDGVQYYFGQNPTTDGNIDAIEITYNITTQNSATGHGASSSWYLNKIVSADGQFSISLIYQAESYSYYTLSMFPIPSAANVGFNAYTHEYDLDKNFINGVRLSRIVFANGEIDFTPGDLRQDVGYGYNNTSLGDVPNSDVTLGARTLGSITITSGSFCKKESFLYSYFYDNTPLTGALFTLSYPGLNLQSDQYRLKLDSIRESTCDGSIAPPAYKFAYFPGTVPRKLGFGIDHWGFYNGVTTNTTLIPAYTIAPPNGLAGIVTNVPGADRDAHWPACQGGALQQITYPTGGVTSFQYESNDVYTGIPVYTKTLRASFSAGYSGLSNVTTSGSFTTNSSSNTYELDMSSNQPSSQSGGNLIFNPGSSNYFVGPGQSSTSYFTLTPSTTYNYTFYDNYNSGQISGYGVSASLYELVPTTVYANSQVGGVRVKTITSKDAVTNNDMVTSYKYTYNNISGGQSSGLLFSRPVYVQAIRNDAWAALVGAACSVSGCFNCMGYNVSYYQSPASIRPMASSQGNHIGYGEVYVSQSGNGYTRYNYYTSNGAFPHSYDVPAADVCVRNLTNFCDPNLPNTPAPPDPYDPMRGELAAEAQYSESGQLLRSSNHLPLYMEDSLITPGLVSRFFVTGAGTGINTFTEYNIQSARKIKDSSITTVYDPASGNYLTDASATYYGSNYHHQPTQTLTSSSKGEILLTNRTYAADFRISNYTVPDQLSTYYTNINTDAAYMSNAFATFSLSTSDPDYYTQRLGIFQNYRYMKAMDRQAYIAYRTNNITGASSVYVTSHNAAKNAADAELKPILELQDAFQNPVIEQSGWKDGNLVHAGFTHYDYAINPANVVYPAKTQMVNIASPSASFTAAVVNGNSLTKDSRYVDEALYGFSAGNPQQTTAHDGITSSYIWDYFNSEPVAKIMNAAPDQVAYTSFEGNGTGNWIIPSAGRDNSGGITGAIAYNLGNGDIVSSNNALNSSQTYIVSYWSTSGAYSVNGAGPVLTGKTVAINGRNWTYYEHHVSGTNSIRLSGNNLVDELRLFPQDAQMLTYTYNPIIGMTSQCDVGNRVTYYEYDGLGRLKDIKDQDGNVLKTIDYHFQGQ